MNDARMTELIDRFASARDTKTRDALVEGYAPLCAAIARRFLGRGVEFEDLNQVALMALVKALERFDASRGLQFITYATHTIVGEIRHYIRDKGSAIRFSRDKMALLTQMSRLQESMLLSLGREPGAKELAEEMHLTAQEMMELLQLKSATSMVSMDMPVGEDEAASLGTLLGTTDTGFLEVENRDMVERLLQNVTAAEKRLLELRFTQRLGQRDVAKAMEISQMQVSRMERRVLARLRNIAAKGDQ